ncbi:hypothetical protein [Roseivirga misakiensis]|uniref:Outer membrane protein beta-barrel domain-containing protein n=1 Tax=Roseivirga misakiensis TaxID=1563681 RepID=A0A1E5SY22_9BACT|nr:hypothetical protein [Roseivirga misakiensis]OEK04021.1 hypothetical protein BFP71_11025 [Roseivirga misakiensis]
MKNLLFIVFTFCALLSYGQNETIQIERKGFIIGFGLGGGVISISDSDQEVPFDEAQFGGTFPNLKFGWMVNDRLAILGMYSGMGYEYEGKDRTFDAFMPSVQYWVKDRWWINAGAGLAMDFPAFYEDNIEDEDWNFGGAVSFSTGYELVQRRNFALDLQTQLQMGWTNINNNLDRDAVLLSFGIGFNWY